MKIPMMLANDRLALQMAIKSCNEIDREHPKVVHIHTTMDMALIEISEALIPAAKENPAMEILGEPFDLPFDEHGDLPVEQNWEEHT